MAITVHQNPQDYTPSDNPVVWVFSSNQTIQANFYFLIEVYIDNVVTERHRVYPEQGSRAHFNASFITERKAQANSGNYYDHRTLNEIKIKITEYYSGSAQSNTTTSNIKFFKARLRKSDFVEYNYQNYVLSSSSTSSKFLTLIPRGTDKAKGFESKLISVLTDGSGVNFRFKTYTSLGVLIDNVGVNIPAGDNLINLVCGVEELIADISLNFTNAAYYTIDGDSGGGVTEIYKINIDTVCDYAYAKRLHWMNSLGGIDSYTFGLISREKTEVKSFGYEREFGAFDSSGNYEFDMKRGTVVDYLKKFNRKISITSNWMSAKVQNWLSKSLYTSPLVWLEENNELYRVKITNKTFETKLQENDMLIQETAEIELESDESVNL